MRQRDAGVNPPRQHASGKEKEETSLKGGRIGKASITRRNTSRMGSPLPFVRPANVTKRRSCTQISPGHAPHRYIKRSKTARCLPGVYKKELKHKMTQCLFLIHKIAVVLKIIKCLKRGYCQQREKMQGV